MTIVVNGDEYIVEQVEKQLNKVIQVIKVQNVLQPGSFYQLLSLAHQGEQQRAAARGHYEDRGARCTRRSWTLPRTA